MTHPRARQPIGVNQPPAYGTDYPFRSPSSDIARLFGDFYLSYLDPGLDLVSPLRISWLFGFGSNAVTPPDGFPTPTHFVDLIVVDAYGATVFDSTAALDFTVLSWGERLMTIQWTGATAICQCTIHTTFAPDAPVILYDQYITPVDATLDPRTYERVPLRLDSLRASVLGKRTGGITLEAGFNVVLEAEEEPHDDGGRLVRRVVVSAIPGKGLGKQPGCEDLNIFVRMLNGVSADSAGNFQLELKDCFRAQPPLAITNVSPRTADYIDPSTIVVTSDCSPCCECDDYIRVYKGLSRTWDRGQALANQLLDVRATYHANRERWLDQRECRMAAPLRLTLSPAAGCRLAALISYCNMTTCCLAILEVYITGQYFVNGVETAPPGPVTVEAASVIEDGASVPYTLDGVWPTYIVRFENVDAQLNAVINLRLVFDNCAAGHSVLITTSAHSPDMPGCEQPSDVLPPGIVVLQPLPSPYPTRDVISKAIPLNSSSGLVLG